jgi:hypothetical protein
MAFDNRRYVVIPVSALDQIDFSQVLETSADTCRRSVDGTKTFVKYEGDIPASVVGIAGRSAEYTHGEMIALLDGPEWTAPMSEEM